jgi:hypothetical protein
MLAIVIFYQEVEITTFIIPCMVAEKDLFYQGDRLRCSTTCYAAL